MAYQQFYETQISRNLREKGQCGAAKTGTIAAALADDAVIWTLKYPEISQGAGIPGKSTLSKRLYVERIHIHTVTGTAFTTPVTLGRGLELVRGAPTSGNTASNPSGGAAFTMVRKRSDLTSSDETLAIGRVATTGALTTTGYTFESNAIRHFVMSQVGDSGADYDEEWRFDGVHADPLYLLPGEVLAIRAAAAFDAAGTWEAAITVDCVEVP